MKAYIEIGKGIQPFPAAQDRWSWRLIKGNNVLATGNLYSTKRTCISGVKNTVRTLAFEGFVDVMEVKVAGGDGVKVDYV